MMTHGDRARTHTIDHLVYPAELRIGEYLDFYPPVGALFHELGYFVGIERLRCVGHANVRIAQFDLRNR